MAEATILSTAFLRIGRGAVKRPWSSVINSHSLPYSGPCGEKPLCIWRQASLSVTAASGTGRPRASMTRPWTGTTPADVTRTSTGPRLPRVTSVACWEAPLLASANNRTCSASGGTG